MFTIEHEFDSTVITLVDEGQAPLQEDVVVNGFEECVTVEQYDQRQDQTQKSLYQSPRCEILWRPFLYRKGCIRAAIRNPHRRPRRQNLSCQNPRRDSLSFHNLSLLPS